MTISSALCLSTCCARRTAISSTLHCSAKKCAPLLCHHSSWFISVLFLLRAFFFAFLICVCILLCFFNRHSGVHVVGVGLSGQPVESLRTKCWMYYPEPEVPFFRVTLFSHYSKENVALPDAQWSLMCEVSSSSFKPAPGSKEPDEKKREQAIIDNVIKGSFTVHSFFSNIALILFFVCVHRTVQRAPARSAEGSHRVHVAPLRGVRLSNAVPWSRQSVCSSVRCAGEVLDSEPRKMGRLEVRGGKHGPLSDARSGSCGSPADGHARNHLHFAQLCELPASLLLCQAPSLNLLLLSF